MRLTGWFSKKNPLPSPAPPLVASAAIEVSAADQQRAMNWFADQEAEWLALGRDSLCALAQASPQPVDPPAGDYAPLAWLQDALAHLEALSEKPLPPAAGLPWRYLLFVRVLCDALETAYQAAFRRGPPMRCPLTRTVETHPPSRAWRPASPGIQAIYSGLGTLLAGRWLPKTGQKWLYAALAQGIEWTDSAAFWAQVNAARTTPPPPASLPEAPVAAVEPRTTPPTRAAPARNRAASSPGAARAAPTTPPSLLDADMTGVKTPPRQDGDPFETGTRPSHPTALSHAVRQVLQDLIHHPQFNRQEGPGWRTGEAYWVTAKPFAEALMGQSWIQTAAFRERREIYQCMGRQGLLLPQGSAPIWMVVVADPGAAMPRRVSALKLPRCLELSPGPLYPGRLQPDLRWIATPP